MAGCFEGLWGVKTYHDLYLNGVQNNSLNLIYKINKKASISIKTPVGISEESEIRNKIMQGEVFSSTLCTSTLDLVSQECPLKPYKYRNSVEITKAGFLDDILDITYCGSQTQHMNTYTNDEISKRKLQFSVDKCKRMHIGKKKNKCKEIFIDNWKIECKQDNYLSYQTDVYQGKLPVQDTSKHIYLGEVVCDSLTNKANITSKISKCQGIKNDILFILNNIYYGDSFFEIVKLLRNSMFLSVLLGNCEIWPNVIKSDLKRLETCDKKFLAQIMGVSSKGSYSLMLLEGGLLPIRHVIIAKRLNYLYTLLKNEPSSLARQIFDQQCKSVQKQDWTSQIMEDLKEFEISLSFQEIEKLSKYKYKKIIKQASFKVAFKYLTSEKQKLSKGNNLYYSSLKTQNYLKQNTGLTTQDMKQIFSIRTRNLFLKTNFPGMFLNDKCVNIACEERDTEFHLFYSNCFKNENAIIQTNLEFNDIFSNNVSKQKIIKDIIIENYKRRLNILSSMIRSR